MELLKLIGLLFGPGLAALLCVFLLGGRQALKIDVSKGLFRQGLFWLCIVLPCFYFAVVGLVIWSQLSLDVSASGINKFFEVSKVPLAILALMIPLVVLFSRFYAAEQSAAQILLTKRKNDMEAFYLHRKEFFGYFDRVGEVNYWGVLTIKNRVMPHVHSYFFSGSPENGVPENDSDAFGFIDNKLASLRFFINAALKSDDEDKVFSFYVAHICHEIYFLSSRLGLGEIYLDLVSKGIEYNYRLDSGESQRTYTIGQSADQLVASFRACNDFFRCVCDFAGYPKSVVSDDLKYINHGGRFSEMPGFKLINKFFDEKDLYFKQS